MDALATDISPSAQATVDGLVSDVSVDQEQAVTPVETVPVATSDVTIITD